MRSVVAEISMSLDGFITGPNDSDELQIHLVPVLLGNGRRLFDPADTGPVELQIDRVIASPSVTHLRYRTAP